MHATSPKEGRKYSIDVKILLETKGFIIFLKGGPAHARNVHPKRETKSQEIMHFLIKVA